MGSFIKRGRSEQRTALPERIETERLDVPRVRTLDAEDIFDYA